MQLHWFRNDLRTQDNTALLAAAQRGAVLALYVISPQQWQQHDDAPCKIDFWYRNLQQLQVQLARLNIPLLLIQVDVWSQLPERIQQLCQQHGIDAVHANQEYGINEQARDNAVRQHLQAQGVAFHVYNDQLLFPVGSIRNQSGHYFKVFSQFKKVAYQQLYQHLPPVQPAPPVQAVLAIQPQPVPHFSPLANADNQAMDNPYSAYWPAGEQAALQRLDAFVDAAINQYEQTRDFPALQAGTSQLSAYLAAGVVSVRQCLHAALVNTRGELLTSNEGVNTWLNELLWREFYKNILHGFPQVSRHRAFKPETEQIAWRDAPEELAAWQQGNTGLPLIDAAMKQLLATGWMHNRLRMLVAMFLTKNLLIDWRQGERWFMQHLIDGDLAANNGGWQWSASTGTDSVPYFRIFNPITQSQKFDPDGVFIRDWLPELAKLDNKTIHAPFQAKDKRHIPLHYQTVMVDLPFSRQRALDAFKR